MMAAAAVADRHEVSGQREAVMFIEVAQIVDVALPPRRRANLETAARACGSGDQRKHMVSWLVGRSTIVPDSRSRP